MTTDARREELFALLGDLPDNRQEAVTSRLISTEEREKFFLEKLVLGLNGIEPVDRKSVV